MKSIFFSIIILFVISSCDENIVGTEDKTSLRIKSYNSSRFSIEIDFGLYSSYYETHLIKDLGYFDLCARFEGITHNDTNFVSSMTFEITKSGNNFREGWAIGSITNSMFDFSEEYSGVHEIYKGGTYDIRARAVIGIQRDGDMLFEIIYSDIITLYVEYPDVDDIIQELESDMMKVWEEKSIHPSNVYGKQEYGFYILVQNAMIIAGDLHEGNTSGDACGETTFSVEVTGDETSDLESPCREGNKYVVAHFHTHPPLSNCPATSFRPAGESEKDIEWIGKRDQIIAGIVYDYVGNKNGEVRGGHALDAVYKPYKYGSPRRNDDY